MPPALEQGVGGTRALASLYDNIILYDLLLSLRFIKIHIVSSSIKVLISNRIGLFDFIELSIKKKK